MKYYGISRPVDNLVKEVFDEATQDDVWRTSRYGVPQPGA